MASSPHGDQQTGEWRCPSSRKRNLEVIGTRGTSILEGRGGRIGRSKDSERGWKKVRRRRKLLEMGEEGGVDEGRWVGALQRTLLGDDETDT